MTKYEKFYTKNIDVIIAEISKITLPKKFIFSRYICGDNKLVEKLKKNNIINDYISYDISPAKKYYGNILVKDWLKEKEIREKKTIVGFNPPYGFGSKKAKEFIYKGYKENIIIVVGLYLLVYNHF